MKGYVRKGLSGSLLVSVGLLSGWQVYGASGEVLRADARAPVAAIKAADYVSGSDHAPDGKVLGVSDRYLTLAGKPWIPVMGEMHYSRVPEAEWDEDLAKMKAAGVDVVSTYIIWIYHEEAQGEWDWSGNRNLRHFAELCKKHGLLLMVRVGPWAHAETRNGGLPDWVMKAGPVRQMDPKFMAETKDFYDQIGMQLHGLLWKDGGPVTGVQIENEYGQTGPGKGAAYILALKALALKAGLDVPLYTVTGWDNAIVPKSAFLPVFGGYPAAPWGGTTAKLPPQEVYAFRFNNRVSGNMGMIGAVPPAQGADPTAASSDLSATPFLTAEVGGGIEDTYHRRPVMSADDIAAMVPVMLGSGVNGYGTYMMVGGEDASGKLSTFQESQATGYPTDVPVKSYDFQAPIGEFGLERRSLRLLKEWNYFMQDYGPLLAPMSTFAPAVRPRDPQDLSVLRWSVRTDGKTGFIFLNNYVRGVNMAAKKGVQFAVDLPQGRTAKIPDQPIDIPSGAFFAWPFGLPLGGGVELRYATAQLMSEMTNGAAAAKVLFCLRNVRCELSLGGSNLSVEAPSGISMARSGDTTLLTRGKDAPALSVLTIHSKETSGTTGIRLILLSPEAAEDTWSVKTGGVAQLVRTSADVWAENDSFTLAQLDDPVFHFSVYPATVATLSAEVALKKDEGGFRAALPPVHLTASVEQERAAAMVPPVHLGPPLSWRPVGVAQAPDDQVWAAAAGEWRVKLNPQAIPAGVSNVFLRVNYIGDEGRLVSRDGTLLQDDFWNGQPWLIGMHRFATAGGSIPDMQLTLLPIRADAPLYLSDDARAALPKQGQSAEVKSIKAIPEYQLRIKVAEGSSGP